MSAPKNARRGGLGRGLGALIPSGPAVVPSAPVLAGTTGPVALVSEPAPTLVVAAAEPVSAPNPPEPQLAPVPGARFAEVPVDAIQANVKQPRQVFDEDALEELKASISEVGFLQPIVVRELEPGRYELVMGERRWRAAQELEREVIPAIIRDTRDDAMLRDALLENIHRADLNPLEEAAAYQQLLEEFGVTHEELAKRIGRSRSQITNTIRLLNLPAQVQQRVAAGIISAGHGRALLPLNDAERQDAMADRIVGEGLSVRTTEELVTLALSDGDQPQRTAPTQRVPQPVSPGLTDLADRLSDRFETRVKVNLGQRKGKITIEFATVEDLDRIVGLIGMVESDGE